MQADLEKIKHYCAYQERCHSEVRNKLLEMNVYGEELEDYISILITENFLNEERFACSYASGKFNVKQWGRNKIKYHLRGKQISAYLVQKALQEIDEAEYAAVLEKLAQRKFDTLKSEKNKFILMQKVSHYLLQKGFEHELVNTVVRQIAQGE